MKSFSIANVTDPIDIGTFLRNNDIKNLCAITVDEERISTSYVLEKLCELNFYFYSYEIGKMAHRDATYILLAIATKRLYPNVKLAGGGNSRTEFYYDFDTDTSFSQEDLEKIEREMLSLCKKRVFLQKVDKDAKEYFPAIVFGN